MEKAFSTEERVDVLNHSGAGIGSYCQAVTPFRSVAVRATAVAHDLTSLILLDISMRAGFKGSQKEVKEGPYFIRYLLPDCQ